ncbi:acid phosphatase AphA [Rhizodiscina lignyota]|uniref:Purple acid phosphatase n=1 Tax=Rhizodiscina lignyota TaxID=1504668 RepID=A0A9P4M8R5_9PEZI|nr:acid phosphatase AphA [Rhizodiscina lignyota]
MKTASRAAFLAALLVALPIEVASVPAPEPQPDVDTRFPYTGPKVPVGDWVDPTINGNGKGFPRLVEAPAVKPKSFKPKNNINVISTSYVPNGVNIHYQTPFGLGTAPLVHWGPKKNDLCNKAFGLTKTYDRTPPCSEVVVTQCSQFFHDVQIGHLKSDTTYYYQIQAANGTTASEVLSFKTSRAAGDKSPFSIGVLNDMGYTNAHGTFKYLNKAIDEGISFAWHGGDISYADDWYSGILPCESDWPVCYNGTSTELPGGPPIPAEYLVPLPEGEIANQGGPQGGDMNVLYESNWDLWQQWMNSITKRVPYMILPGNHEAACAEFDGPNNELTAYLVEDKANSTANKTELTYYSCPPSQRNFTTYQHRFTMPGDETGGVGNFWYSFDFGLAHFVSINTETDFAFSPEWPFVRDTKGHGDLPAENQTFITDSGPFGYINGNYTDNTAYEQYQWLLKDLKSVDRKKTPWVIVMGHRPMWSSQVASYQEDIRDAFQAIMVENGVDLYMAGHIHWYERMWPLDVNGSIVTDSIANNNTYRTNPGKSMIHLTNGMAGNIESHSTLNPGQSPLNITSVLDQKNYGFSTITVESATKLTWKFIHGVDGSVGDELTVVKKGTGPKGYSGPPGFNHKGGPWIRAIW